ncbi:MAG: FkbM family methyltransferase [Candidatus Gastranaerophilales bacterium]|nr:FkbM family methyltransferase [Candidatus Gastranaerophilales bacterium]
MSKRVKITSIIILTVCVLSAAACCLFWDYIPFKYKYALEIYRAKDLLADDYSRNVFHSAVKFHSNYKVNVPNFYADYGELDNPYVYVHKKDYIIDAGVSGDVELTVLFLKQCGPDGKVFGIEPNPNVLNKIKQDLKNYKNFQLFEYALWESDGKGEFDLGAEPDDEINLAAHLVLDNFRKRENIISVNLIKLDNLIEKNQINKVDFIKMDIEGAEVQALKGSKKTIAKYNPDLALSCHFPDDFLKFILFIHSINPKYKIYLAEHEPSTDMWRNYVVYATTRNAEGKPKDQD